MTPFEKYLKCTLDLIEAGLESEQAERIREEMDVLWPQLFPHQTQLVGRVSDMILKKA